MKEHLPEGPIQIDMGEVGHIDKGGTWVLQRLSAPWNDNFMVASK